MGDNLKTDKELEALKLRDRKEMEALVGRKSAKKRTTPISRNVVSPVPEWLDGARGINGLGFDQVHHDSVHTPGDRKEKKAKAKQGDVACSKNLFGESDGTVPSTVTVLEEADMVERTAQDLLGAMMNGEPWDPQAENLQFNQRLQRMEDDMGTEFWRNIDTLMSETNYLYIEPNDMTIPFVGVHDDVNMDTGEFLKQNIPIKF